MLTYAEYRTKFMVRTAQQLRSKKPINTNIITLPRASLIHYVSDSQSEYGIRRSHPLLVNDTVPIRVYHVDELKVATGRPIKRTVNTIQMLNNYFKEATGSLTRIRHLDRTMKEVRAIVVLDYSLLPVKYYYPKTKTSFFDELDNIFNTQISKINEIGESREQFIVFKLPKVVPQYAKLRILPDPIPSGKLNEWKDHEAYGLLYIWRLLNKQSIIKPEAAKKLTLVFQEGGYVTQVNCADLFAWYNEDPLNTEKSLYKVWTQLQNTRIGDIPEEEETSADPTNNKASELEADEDIDGVSSSIDSDYANDIEDEEIPAFVNIHTLNETMRDLANAGKLSGAEQKRFVKIAKSYVDIPNPVGEGTLKDLLEVPTKYKTLDPYKEIIPSKPGLVDKSMTRSTMDEFTKNYVRHVMQADIAASILSVQNAGVLVKDYKVTNTVDALNNYDTHTVSLIPINGKPSTISIKLPVVNEEGEFLANSVVRKLDSQKSDIPIRKINHSKVALTSYYGKVFVNRSGKAVDSYSRWIANKITNAAMDADNTLITDIVFSTSAIPKNKLPRGYTAVGESIARFVTHDYSFNFNYKAREKLYGKDVVERIEKTGAVICGKVISEKDTYLSMGVDGTIFKVSSNNNALVLGSLPSIINSEWGEGPVEFATVRVFGKNVPLVIVLSSILGLDKVLEMLKVPHRWAEGSDQTKYTSNEMRIRFSGESLIIDKRHAVGAMVIAGLHAVRHVIKEYTGSDLNRKDIYGHILESVGIGRHVLREIGLMNRMFIDPITKEILEDRKEPTTFIGLLLMAADLLTTDEHPDEMDPAFMRIRGYERFTGFIYNQLIGAIRTHETSHNPSRSQVSINPTAVWGDLLADPAIVLVEESNPIHNLKEKESVTFSGQGGRSGETMVARTRVFHENDVGLISESTPDSGKVGIRSYLAPNAKLANVRGLSNRFDYSKDTLTNALSSTSLINPGTVHMDGKRVNLASVQQSSMVSARGGKLLPVRTGYEQVIANRCSDKFAYDAKGDGTVLAVDDKFVTIEYKDEDGTTIKAGLKLGVAHGKASGAIIPHTMVTDLRAGTKFKKGDILVWNTGYFERDILNPNGVSMKGGTIARVALIETNDTLEDGCAISPKLSKALGTPISKAKTLLLTFDQSVTNMVSIGDKVDIDTILAIIEDGSLAGIAGNDKNLLGLTKLSGSSPKAKLKGVVSNIEVVWMGDKADMHPTLRNIANADARRRKETQERTGADIALHGEVTEPTFVFQQKLTANTMAITIFMDMELTADIGDKAVFDNVLKSIIGRVMEGTNTTEDGKPIDAVFSYRGIADRVVLSPEINGTTNSVMIAVSKKFAEIYNT